MSIDKRQATNLPTKGVEMLRKRQKYTRLVLCAVLVSFLSPVSVNAKNLLDYWLGLSADAIRCEEAVTVAECYMERAEKRLKNVEYLVSLLDHVEEVPLQDPYIQRYNEADRLAERYQLVENATGDVSLFLAVRFYWGPTHERWQHAFEAASREVDRALAFCNTSGADELSGCADVAELYRQLDDFVSRANTVQEVVDEELGSVGS